MASLTLITLSATSFISRFELFAIAGLLFLGGGTVQAGDVIFESVTFWTALRHAMKGETFLVLKNGYVIAAGGPEVQEPYT